MADSIVGGLFGMTPEMYQQQQNQNALKQASELAQLDPFALAKTGIGYGANRLAGAIGGALGGQDPQLQLISQRNAVMREINLNDPNSIMSGVQRLGQFDPQGATILSNYAREAIAKNAESTQKFAQANKAMAETGEIGSKRDLLNSRVQALIDAGTPENLAKGIASNDKAFADFVMARNISTPADYAIQARALGFEAKPFLKDYTPEQVQAMEKGVFAHKAGIAKAGSSSMIIPIDKMFDKAFTAQDAEKQATSWNLAGEAFATIPSTRQKLADVRSLIDNSFTGTGANVKLGASKLARALNLPVDINKASNTEITEALTTQFAITELKKNFGSNPAVKDFEYQLKVKPGILQEPETFKRLVSNLEKGLVAEEVAYKRGEQYKQNNKGSIYGFNPYSAKAEATTQVNRYYELINLADKAKAGKGQPLTQTQIQEAQTLQKELGGNL
jgi:hypothetical protein